MEFDDCDHISIFSKSSRGNGGSRRRDEASSSLLREKSMEEKIGSSKKECSTFEVLKITSIIAFNVAASVGIISLVGIIDLVGDLFSRREIRHDRSSRSANLQEASANGKEVESKGDTPLKDVSIISDDTSSASTITCPQKIICSDEKIVVASSPSFDNRPSLRAATFFGKPTPKMARTA